MRLLFVYRFLTHGGVEAVLKARIKALKRLDNSLNIGVLFLYKFAETVVKFGDNIYLTNDYEEIRSILKKYEVVSVIDAPEVFELLEFLRKPFILEVHTQYIEDRMYLQKPLPSNIIKILTPSKSFKKIVEKELEGKGSFNIECVYNPVDYSFFESGGKDTALSLSLQKFRPILWVGRLDYLKDWERALSIFSKLIKKVDTNNLELFFVGRCNDLQKTISTFKKYNIFTYIRYVPSIDFHLMPLVYRKVALNGGIYLSTSKGESFGMTVAESMASDLPCVLNKLEVFEEITDKKAVYFDTDQEAIEAIIKLLKDRELYVKIAKDLKDISRRYHPDNIAKTLYEKFREVLK